MSYGIADDEAWTVGLPCGGEIDVFVEPFARRVRPSSAARATSSSRAKASASAGTDDARARTELREETGRSVFVEAVAPPPRLVAVGAGDIAEALCALARPLGWHTVVVDPRAGLATRERVPSADELIVAWPDEIEVDAGTALVSLVHEERLDIPALRRGVEGGAFYVGALGSKPHAGEAARASSATLADQVRGPVGLDLGGETPAEIALEILAEMLAGAQEGRGARRRRRPQSRAPPALGGRSRPRADARRSRAPSIPMPSTKCSQLSAVFDGDPVAAADDAEQPQRQVDDTAADQEGARALGRLRERDADDAEEQVHEVVQDRHLEDAEQLRAGVVPGEAQVAVVRR